MVYDIVRRTPWTVLRTTVCFCILSSSLISVSIFSVWCYYSVSTVSQWLPPKQIISYFLYLFVGARSRPSQYYVSNLWCLLILLENISEEYIMSSLLSPFCCLFLVLLSSQRVSIDWFFFLFYLDSTLYSWVNTNARYLWRGGGGGVTVFFNSKFPE